MAISFLNSEGLALGVDPPLEPAFETSGKRNETESQQLHFYSLVHV